MFEEIKNAFNSMILDEVIEIKLLNSNQNKVYEITTKDKKYIIKKYVGIDNESDLLTRKEQIRISKIWNESGINTVLPITDIFKCLDDYYIIYPFVYGIIYEEGDMDIFHIKKVAKVLARIHSLNIETFLNNHTKIIDYNRSDLKEFIEKNNNACKKANGNLCVCHNDFKPLNIMWKEDEPYLIDFDAVEKNNRTFSLLEAAYTFSHIKENIDLEKYKVFIDEYKSSYNGNLENVDEAIYGCWNGKLQWLLYLKENRAYDEDVDLLTNELINYDKYIAEIKDILK